MTVHFISVQGNTGTREEYFVRGREMKNATTDHYFGVGIGLDAMRRSINHVLICQTGAPIVPRGVNTHVVLGQGRSGWCHQVSGF